MSGERFFAKNWFECCSAGNVKFAGLVLQAATAIILCGVVGFGLEGSGAKTPIELGLVRRWMRIG